MSNRVNVDQFLIDIESINDRLLSNLESIMRYITPFK